MKTNEEIRQLGKERAEARGYKEKDVKIIANEFFVGYDAGKNEIVLEMLQEDEISLKTAAKYIGFDI